MINFSSELAERNLRWKVYFITAFNVYIKKCQRIVSIIETKWLCTHNCILFYYYHYIYVYI